jgi:hypothetical protein
MLSEYELQIDFDRYLFHKFKLYKNGESEIEHKLVIQCIFAM